VILAVSIVLWFPGLLSKNAEVKPLEKELRKVEQTRERGPGRGQRAEAAAAAPRRCTSRTRLPESRSATPSRARGGLHRARHRAPGFDWKIGIALLSSFAAREVMVSTCHRVQTGDADQTSVSLRRSCGTRRSRTGERSYSPLMAVSLMVFFVLACQCMSTWPWAPRDQLVGWPIFMVVMMNALAWIASSPSSRAAACLGLG